MNRLKGLLILLTLLLIATSSWSQYAITPDLPLEEYTLDGRVLTITVTDSDTLYTLLDPGMFLLVNAPVGLFIESVNRVNNFIVELTLDWMYTDFDTDSTNFYVELQPAAMKSGLTKTTDVLPITAYPEVPTAILTPDIPLEETTLDGRILNLKLTDEWFVNPGALGPFDFSLQNAPAGLSIASAVALDSSEAELTLSFDFTDFDADSTNFRIYIDYIQMVQSPGGLTSEPITITAHVEVPTATINSDSILTEQSLDWRYIDLVLTYETFEDYASIAPADFNLVNAPVGTSIESVVGILPTEAQISLAFDGTDFDTDVTNFHIDINAGTLLETPSGYLSSNNLTILASVEAEGPQVLDVSIPDTPMKIGDNVPVTITVEDDQGMVYTLLSGTIGQYPLSNLVRLNNTTYTASIQVTEGGAEFLAAEDIPVSDLQLMGDALPGNLFNGFISQSNDPIDSRRPVVLQATLLNTESLLMSGDTIRIRVRCDSTAYLLDDISTVNGVSAGNANVSYTDNGDSTYTLEYIIAFGDPDVDSATLAISIVMNDAVGNQSTAFTALDPNSLRISATMAQLLVAADSVLIEKHLDGRILTARLANESFINHLTLVPANFSLVNAPGGLSIGSLTSTTADSLLLHLTFDGTDFADTVSDLQLSIEPAVLTNSTVDLFSYNILMLIPDALALTYIKTDVSASGAVDGSVDLSVTGGAPPYFYNWSNGAFMEDLTMLAAGNYTVTVSDSRGTEIFESIEILDTFDLCGFSVDFSYSVDGSTVTFTNLSGADQYNWQFGDGSVSEAVSPTHTYSYPGLYNVCLMGMNSAGDCMVEECKKIEAGTMDCSAEFGFLFDSLDANKVHFTNTTQGAADRWYWNFGDGKTSTLKDPVHTFPEPGHYEVCLNSLDQATGCQSKFCLDITVGSVEVKADFTYFVDPVTRKVMFSDHSTGDITSWYWTFGDGSVHMGQDTVHRYSKAGKYTVCLIAWNEVSGSRDELCRVIQVGTPACNVRADFSYFIDESTRQIRMTDLSTGTITSWFWDFGDGVTSSKKSPSHAYADSGMYLVKLSVRDNANNCFDSRSEWVQVGGIDCKSDFTYTVDPASRTVEFLQRARGTIAEYFWNLDDGTYSSDDGFTHTYAQAGRYNVSLTVIDESGQCMDYHQEEVQVGKIDCSAEFDYFVDSASNEVYFLSNVMGTATDLLWIFGDGYMTEAENPVHKFPAPGYYSVGLNTFDSLNGCMDYYEDVVLIGSQGMDCMADFIYRADLETREVKFTSKAQGDISSHLWDFGDGNTSPETNPVHLYDQSKNYWVCLTVVNSAGYSDTWCKQIQVASTEAESCMAGFMFSVDSVSRTATFKDKSFGTPDSWNWDFEDGSTSSQQNPVHTFSEPGYYTVRLDIRNSATGCAHSAIKLVNVSQGNQGIRADFIYDTTSNTKKADTYPVDFIGVSLGDGSKLKWTFGDGDVDSTSLNPTHVYTMDDPYEEFEVCFEVSNPITTDNYEECRSITLGSNVNVPYVFGEGLALANHPNPFERTTRIVYRLADDSPVNLSVCGLDGKRLRELENGTRTAGVHTFEFNRDGLGSGIYLLKLTTADGFRIVKMIIR